jgi:hypothetical protein
MKYLVMLLLLPAACATSRPTTAAKPESVESRAAVAGAPVSLHEGRLAREAPRGPTLDRQGCDPKGHASVVVEQGANGKPAVWRYYVEVKRHGGSARVLKCEASDNNGDGFIDARFFYDDNGQLVLEQRDLDFDGHAEVVADYSHFSVGHLVQASDKE